MVSLNPGAYLLLTVEVTHTKNPGWLHQWCKRIDDTVVVCNQLINSLSKRIEINRIPLTWDHRQAIAHGNDIRACGSCVRLGSRVDIFSFWETERPHILTGNRNVFPSQSFEPLAGDIAKGRRKINQVDVFEKRLDGQESRHDFDVIPIISVKGDLYDCLFSMLTQYHRPSKSLASISKKTNQENRSRYSLHQPRQLLQPGSLCCPPCTSIERQQDPTCPLDHKEDACG